MSWVRNRFRVLEVHHKDAHISALIALTSRPRVGKSSTLSASAKSASRSNRNVSMRMRQRARVIYGAKAGETDAGRRFDGRYTRKTGEDIDSIRFIIASTAEAAAFDSSTAARISSGLMCTFAGGRGAWGGPFGKRSGCSA